MKQNRRIDAKRIWLNTVSGFLATVLGIAVTIGVARWQEKREIKQNKRDLTIMIIHDLDHTEEMMRLQLDEWNELNDRAQYVLKHKDALDSVPIDTILSALSILRIPMDLNLIEYPEMAESIMKGNLDTWTTLSNVEFMSNVESCYSQRRKYNEFIVSKEVWEKSIAKYYEINNLILKEKKNRSRKELIRELARQLYASEEVLEYVSDFDWAMEYRNGIMANIHCLNAENKWLMSVTEDDLNNYLEASSKRAPADRKKVTRKDMIGTWEFDLDMQRVQHYLKRKELVLNEDKSSRYILYCDRTESSCDSVITHIITGYGHWTLSEDNMTLTFDSVGISKTASGNGNFNDWETFLTTEKNDAEESFTTRCYNDILLGTNDFAAMGSEENNEDESIKRYLRVEKQ